MELGIFERKLGKKHYEPGILNAAWVIRETRLPAYNTTATTKP
jgi:hypothetical protein